MPDHSPVAPPRLRLGALGARFAVAAGFILAICATAGASQAQSLATPFSQGNVPLASLASQVQYTIDMSSLPARPRLIVEATPDAAHADMQLELQISNCTLDNPVAPGSSFFCPSPVSTPNAGLQTVSYDAFFCETAATIPAYPGETCRVTVRALNFGAAPAPATFNVVIRGDTIVPTSTVSTNVVPPTPVNDDIPTTTAQYFNEGQNFRWIYDLDGDKVLVTPIQGRCEWSPPGGFLINMPYTYQYQGNPTYHGLDCCTWQISSSTGVTGTGQALFFINVDSSLPANQPPDSDIDGIKNLCDNCPTVPNGPLFGTCTSGPRTGSTCRSNQECNNFPCSLSQDDADRNGTGDACPEPGLAAMLGAGLAALHALGARRRTRARA